MEKQGSIWVVGGAANFLDRKTAGVPRQRGHPAWLSLVGTSAKQARILGAYARWHFGGAFDGGT